MNVKISKICLTLFVIFMINGCGKTIYVDRPVEVKVPVKCIVPKIECSYDKPTYTEIIKSLLDCIETHKEVAKVCQ